MAIESNIEKLNKTLSSCSRLVNRMHRDIVDGAGNEGRSYTKHEEWMLKRIECIKQNVKTAQFEAKRMNFNYDHEVQ